VAVGLQQLLAFWAVRVVAVRVLLVVLEQQTTGVNLLVWVVVLRVE
jgi:hypothetical protein